MRKTLFKMIVVVAALAMILSACGPKPAEEGAC